MYYTKGVIICLKVYLKRRCSVSETWDLVDLFKDDQQYYESIDALVQQANQFHHTYATTLNSIEQINTA